MGYGGKVAEQQRARELRAKSWTLQDIATALGVSKSSVSLWVRDVEFVPSPRSRARQQRPSSLRVRKLAEIESMDRAGVAEIGRLSEREFLLFGVALYLGEGFKSDGPVGLANTDPDVLWAFVTWLRRFFSVDETRLRVRIYLHAGLD
jgi:transcriptional regulator with XRE-family HTH domain